MKITRPSRLDHCTDVLPDTPGFGMALAPELLRRTDLIRGDTKR